MISQLFRKGQNQVPYSLADGGGEEYEGRVRERSAQRQEHHSHRVAYDRFRIAMVLGMLVVVGFGVTVLIIAAREYVEVDELDDLAIVTFRLSKVLAAVVEESTASIRFCRPGLVNDLPDTVLLRYISDYQRTTRTAFAEASADTDGCTLCANILGRSDMEQLLFTQQNVIRRSYTPLECFWAYYDIITSLVGAMNFFLGSTLPPSAVGILWMDGLTSGIGVLAELAPGIAPGGRPQERVQKIYDSVSRGVTSYNVIELKTEMLMAEEPEWREKYLSILHPLYSTSKELLSDIRVDLTGITVVTPTMTAEEALKELSSQFKGLLSSIEKEKPWQKGKNSVQITTLATQSLAIFFAFATIGCALYAALKIVWYDPLARREKEDAENLLRSMERMDYFVTRLFNLDQDGLLKAVERVQTEPFITPAEGQLLDLAPKMVQVLGYINHEILLLRKRILLAPEDGSKEERDFLEGHSGNSFELASKSVNVLSGSEEMSKQSSFDTTDDVTSHQDLLSGTPRTVSPPLSNSPEKSKDRNRYHADLKIFSQSVCFLLVDISCFCVEVKSAALAKTIPLTVASCLSTLMRLTQQRGGYYVNTAGSIILFAFNEAEVADTENVAMATLASINAEVLSDFPDIRCAVLSGVVPHGLIGTSTYKAFITDGHILVLGGLLLRTAQLHEVTFVVDSATFTKADTQYFYKLALERVGVDERDGESTTVFELIPRTQQVDAHLWNDAFDKFQAEDYPQAREKLRQWRKLHGTPPSFLRFCKLVRKKHLVTYLYATENSFEPEYYFQ